MGISPMIIAAGVGAAGSIGGGLLGANGAESAAQTSANTQLDIFNQTQKNLAPFIGMGTSALTQLSGLLGIGPGGFNQSSAANAMNTLKQMPGYQFQLGQGIQAVDRSAASRGLTLSGGQLKDLTNYGQGYAQNAWNSYLGQLTGVSQLGENAAAGQGEIGASTGANAGNALLQGGLGATNYMVGGLQGALQNASLGYMLSQGQGGYGYGTPGYNQFMAGNYGAAGSDPENIQMSDLSGYDAFPSDVRLKTDIRRVGRTDTGLGVYLYRFKGDSRTQMGVLAQEVERVRPDAVVELPSGFKGVRYGRLSSSLSHLKEAA